MKILVLSPHIPLPMAGASTRNYHILKTLASQHEVTLLTLNESLVEGVAHYQRNFTQPAKSTRVIKNSQSQSKRWAQVAAALRGRSYLLSRSILPEMQEAIDEVVSRESFAAVLCESIMMAGYRLPPGIPVVIDEHNLEYELCWRTYQRERLGPRKLYSLLEARRLLPEELKRCSDASLVLVTSERELSELKRLVPSCAVAVVPNGVDTAFFQPANPQEEVDQRLIFTGSMDYYPNTDAALQFAHRCWPLDKDQLAQATWMIVGKNPPPHIRHLEDLPGVTVTGSVLDVRPYLAQAAAAIAPLLIGGGTRLKILEAFAMQKAVISTSLGCEGLNVEAGRELIVADGPESFAATIVRILRDAPARQALGLAGRKLVEAEYSWDESGRCLLRAVAGIQS